MGSSRPRNYIIAIPSSEEDGIRENDCASDPVLVTLLRRRMPVGHL